MAATRIIKNKFPLRIKVALLLAGTLALSLLSYGFVGSRLIVADKVSYIYDYNLMRVRAASEAVETHIYRLRAGARALGAGVPQDAGRAAYDQLLKPLGVSQALILRRDRGDSFKIDAVYGDPGRRALDLAAKLGWKPSSLGSAPALVGTMIDGVLPVLGQASSERFFLAALRLDAGLLETRERETEIHLVDGLGRTVLARPKTGERLDSEALRKFESDLLKSPFPSGVRDWASARGHFLVGYRRLEGMPLLVVSYVPRAAAFKAADSLWRRSLALGLGILFLALGATLWLARGATRKLREMGFATRQVAKGDFGVRIEPTGLANDEVGELAVSFNTMSEKIEALMKETAVKARMEKELETAQTLQARFFPQQAHRSPEAQVGGRYLPASECAGDWWHYCRAGRYLVTVIGDVTGHGVSSALVTAAVHGAFTLLARGFERSSSPSLEALLSGLNAVVLSAAQGTATMTFLATLYDTETGELTVANASHLAPYVRRARASEGAPVLKRFDPILSERAPALGRAAQLAVRTETTVLEAGDTVFLYTDGLTEQPEGRNLPQRKLFETLDRARSAAPADALGLCDAALSEILQGFAEAGAAARPDDVTLVALQVPRDAKLSPQTAKRAA